MTTTSSNPVMRIEGARTHNLKNLNLDIPLNSFVVITGKSGSGKSSLAIDTIFAEGQRQYIECLSLYARNFFPVSQSIEVDSITGLQPTVCIGQQRGAPNLRSTVGTLTEIYDSLRLLMAKAGQANCPGCGQPVTPQTPQQICESILSLPVNTKAMILAPMVRGRKGQHSDVLETIRKERLVRVRIDGELFDIEQLPEINAAKTHDIEAVTDRIIVRPGIESRLSESVEFAVRLSAGLVLVSSKHPEETSWQELLFSTQAGCPDCQIEVPILEPRLFSFNSPYGACESCHGLGRHESFVEDRILPNKERSLIDGALAILRNRPSEKKFLKGLNPIAKQLNFDLNNPVSALSSDQWHKLLYSDQKSEPGIVLLLEKHYATCTDDDELDWLDQFRGSVICNPCRGSRLNAKANSVALGDKTISDLTSASIADLLPIFEDLMLPAERSQVAAQVLPGIKSRIRYLMEVGLEYLTLNRTADSLSGGELQRVRLAAAIGSGLAGTCYVLDEPSVGMHERDTQRLIQSLRNLQKKGNSLVVVEHDETVMREADYIVDLGPDAGVRGGEIIGQGNCNQLEKIASSITGRYLSGKENFVSPARERSKSSGKIRISGAAGHNLKNIDVEIPLGKLTCVSGVSGSGKSTLINGTLIPAIRQHLGLVTDDPHPFSELAGLEPIEKLVKVDQRPITRSSRGCAATYTGVLDDVRKIFAATKAARQRGFTASRFSFNSKSGRCGQCEGHGVKKVSMKFMADITVPCNSCHGKRYNESTLSVRFRNLSIADVLELSVDEAVREFDSFESLRSKLDCLQRVGLGYLALGQSSSTLSGGEAQRIKLSVALAARSSGSTLYFLDEPTVGLHPYDTQQIINVLFGIVDAGNTVVVIEHNLDMLQAADWIIDLGPEGGSAGGELIFQGAVHDLLNCQKSETAAAMRQRVN